MKNRMIAWVSGVVLVVVTLMVIIVKAGAAQGRNHKGAGNEGHGSGPYGQGRV